ncbi:MAG: metallophosphoesterase [Muribaculaceae bacterium]|nr:metallophosphoesterase [Muribaculaceae bacterium]
MKSPFSRAAMALTLLCCVLTSTAQKRLFVLSDPHLLAPELFQTNSTALQNNLATDSRMFDLSNEIMTAMVSTIIDERPDAVLIPGDLTKQGEKLSHIAMATLLKQVTDAGIKVFVIPGNHDVNNTQAVRYDGAKTYSTATINSSEFVEIYNEMGFSAAIERDNGSLSYVAEPVPGLRLIAIDDSRCVARDNNTSLSANGLSTNTRAWICNQIDTARQQDKQVIVMMHHNLIEHIDDMATFISDAQVAQAQDICNDMMQRNVKLVLTGHTHVSNISAWYNDTRTDSIVEISTGSAIAYPCHYRIIELSPDLSTFQVSTGSITQVDGKPNLLAEAEERMVGSAYSTIKTIVARNWNTFNSKLEQYQSILGGI